MENIYIIGDVHGCYKTLLALIEKLPNKKDSNICFVGDLIDKGNASKDVVEFIKSNNYPCVLGNHEMFFLKCIENILRDLPHDEDALYWLDTCEGKQTMQSYEEDFVLNKELIKKHIKWMKNLPLYIEYKDFKTKDKRNLLVSHSHVHDKWQNRNYPKDSKKYKNFEKALLLSRYKNFDNKDIFNVYGHTPLEKPQINEFKANIDLGCFHKSKNEVGKLCALEFPSMKTYIQENIEE